MADTNVEQNDIDAANKSAADAKSIADAAAAAEAKAKADIEAAERKAEETRKQSQSMSAADSKLLDTLVSERLEKELKGIKEKLDSAYQQRDESNAALAKAEKEAREAQVKRLAEEGKHKEAYELQLQSINAENAALKRQNVELSRDVAVREALRGMPFKNDNAAKVAFQEITTNLIQNEKGQWLHRTGISVNEYCSGFSKDEEFSFLFKAKTNSGGGSSPSNGTAPVTDAPKSLFKMSQAEVIKLAEEGKLGKRT